MSFDQAWWLLLLPLAVLPLFAPAGEPTVYSWLALLPRDRPAELLRWALRAAMSVAIAALVLGLAGPYRPEYPVERVGRGAEIVLVLDRSRSMDQGFARGAPAPGQGPKGTGPEAIDFYFKLSQQAHSGESKGKVARQVLAEFASKRPEDRFGMIAFSTLPIRVLDFTQKPDVIQAAIEAANIGRGLSETDIGLALQAALEYFDGRPYAGSRIVMLVSDGGDHIEPDMRERLSFLVRKFRVSLYWIYLRSANSPGLMADAASAPAEADTVPEYFLHRYFQSLGAPYRAYEAEDPDALKKAVDDVNRLENLPITYVDTVPRRDLATACYALALASVLLLFGASLMETRRWA